MADRTCPTRPLRRSSPSFRRPDPSLGQLPQNHIDFIGAIRATGTPAAEGRVFLAILAGTRSGNAFSEFGSRTAADFRDQDRAPRRRLCRQRPQVLFERRSSRAHHSDHDRGSGGRGCASRWPIAMRRASPSSMIGRASVSGRRPAARSSSRTSLPAVVACPSDLCVAGQPERERPRLPDRPCGR